MNTVGLIDYGSGNYTSMLNALRAIGRNVIEIRAAGQMNDASHLILPGVGAFARAMRQLRELGLVDELRQQVLELRKPFLGVCVGMQILATRGSEFEECDGLDWIPGQVNRIPAGPAGLRLPHVGWNELSVDRREPLFTGMSETPCFYFVHSYQFEAARRESVSARCRYGEELPAVVQQDNIVGVQFHPEKSQRDGLQLLRNFCAWKP